ncbi:phosphatidylethanolamine-binding protein 4 isoform X2 [Sceloporus undulatus]|uniref:phosphatidylethanolamine-binding protein 4 isoform X2 n=1 Tax=Sceloporus undulatus TaxID=8520 RepID=UPI001C4AAC8E|nr:phosphatidylethanolamine-binding protein 4 isoform X2 [Sceloporus undulatus]
MTEGFFIAGTDTMKPLVTCFLIAGFIFIAVQEDVHMEECVFKRLDREDSTFCRGDLKVVYPELGDVGCIYIPKCHFYRKRISKEWSSPDVRYPKADERKKYILIMVDPDAPSRANPKFRFWRHWTLVDIKGADLKNGNLEGHILSDYHRPTPPSQTGYHRYQFFLYEQPNEPIALSPEERSTRGSWDMEDFVDRFDLGRPVASTQFITKNYREKEQ